MRPLYKRFLDTMSTTVKTLAAPAEQVIKKVEVKASGANATTTTPPASGNWAKLQKVSHKNG
jgi:outer membrane murein-binding lipoprotein Lpp